MESPNTQPQYGYRDGLAVDVRRYHPSTATETEETIFLRPSELALPQDDGQMRRQRTYQQVDELLRQPRIEKAANGSSIEYVLLNKHAEGDELEVAHLEWHTAVRDPAVRPLLAAFALTGRRRMVVTSAGMGDSAPLPRSVAKEVARTGSFIPYAETVLPGYEPILADYEAISFTGTSEGGRRAIGLAAIYKYVEDLFSHDAPGSRAMEHGLGGIAAAFAVRERKHLGEYAKAALDPELVTAQRRQDSLRRFGGSILRQIKKRNAANLLRYETAAMSRDGLYGDALRALPNVQNKLVLSSPTFSELNRPEDVEALVRRLSQEAQDLAKPPAAIALMRFNGTHTSGAANMPVTARLYELAREL